MNATAMKIKLARAAQFNEMCRFRKIFQKYPTCSHWAPTAQPPHTDTQPPTYRRRAEEPNLNNILMVPHTDHNSLTCSCLFKSWATTTPESVRSPTQQATHGGSPCHLLRKASNLWGSAPQRLFLGSAYTHQHGQTIAETEQGWGDETQRINVRHADLRNE